MSQDDVSAATNVNVTTLFRLERAIARPQKRTLLALLDAYGVADAGERERLLQMSRDSTRVGWLREYEGDIGEELSAYVAFEAEASSVQNFESSFIPGLLQTEQYAAEILRHSKHSQGARFDDILAILGTTEDGQADRKELAELVTKAKGLWH